MREQRTRASQLLAATINIYDETLYPLAILSHRLFPPIVHSQVLFLMWKSFPRLSKKQTD